MATANNIPSQVEASHPHVGEESGRGRLFRVATLVRLARPSSHQRFPLTKSSQGWRGDAKEEQGNRPTFNLGTFRPVAVLSVRPDCNTRPSTIL